MATTVVKVVVVIMTALSMAMISITFYKSAAITMVSRAFTIKLTASAAFVHCVTASTWATTHAWPASAWGAACCSRTTATSTGTDVAAATTAASAAATTTTAALCGNKGDTAITKCM